MKTIVYSDWRKRGGKSAARARHILAHFDLTELKRRRKAPARARRRRG